MITLDANEAKAIVEVLDMLSGCNPECVLLEAKDPNDPAVSAFLKVFFEAERMSLVPQHLSDRVFFNAETRVSDTDSICEMHVKE